MFFSREIIVIALIAGLATCGRIGLFVTFGGRGGILYSSLTRLIGTGGGTESISKERHGFTRDSQSRRMIWQAEKGNRAGREGAQRGRRRRVRWQHAGNDSPVQCNRWGHMVYNCPYEKETSMSARPKALYGGSCHEVAWNEQSYKYPQ